MKEQILLISSANASELVRTMARHSYNTIGFRIMSSFELARYALQQGGITIGESILPRKEEAALLYSLMKKIEYFKSSAFPDAENISDSLFNIRSLIVTDERNTLKDCLIKGEFFDKNAALIEIYDSYISALKSEKLVDCIGLIRRAISEATRLSADFIVLNEYPVSPLEKSLLEKVSGGNYQALSFQDLLSRKPSGIQIDSYVKAYGESNEVENIIGTILKNNISIDTCTVAVGNPSQYAQLFYDYSLKLDIPMTFGCGVPIINSNAAQLLSALYHFNTDGYCGVDALVKVIFSEAFNRKTFFELCQSDKPIYRKEQLAIVGMMGNLRLTDNQSDNKRKIDAYRATLPCDGKEATRLGYVESISREFEKGYSYLIREYSVIRENLAGRIDRSAVKVICDSLDSFMKFADESVTVIIPELLNKTVCSENSREGCLFVTGIEGATASLRENLFVAGLTANLFPGSPSENYLILDNDYNHFPYKEYAPTSSVRVTMKKKSLFDLLETASSLGIHTQLSYSYYNLTELKLQNPSSVLFEIYKWEHGNTVTAKEFESIFTNTGFFTEPLDGNTLIGRAVVEGKEVLFHTPDKLVTGEVPLPDRAFSPTAIEVFFSCPYEFYLGQLLGIEVPEEDDPFTVISPRDYGKLAHSMMEFLANNKTDRNSFIQKAELAFDEYMTTRPPLLKDTADKEKKDFIRMMTNAYDSDPGNRVLSAEEDKTVAHTSGVKIHGIPDRVEETPDGEYIIADYKTGRTVRHKADDIDTCLQTVLYAYLSEQQSVKISRCEYRYLRDNIKISCRYDNDMKRKLDEKLGMFKAALDSACFEYVKNCNKYCPFKMICGKNSAKKEDTAHE